MEDEQRRAMFDAWQRKQDKKEKECIPHRWSYAHPVHCLDCGKVKDV